LVLPTTADATPFTWNGFYIGGNAGVGFGGDSTSVDLKGFNYFVANPVPGEVTKVGDDSAFIGGGQIGYNSAFNNVVAGIEADFSGFDFQAAKIPASSRADWGSDTRVSVEMNWLATVRGRWVSPWIDGSYTGPAASRLATVNIAIMTFAIRCPAAAAG
jgi:outer membrane immunogenic protein